MENIKNNRDEMNLNRGTGLILIDVTESNPNGDPDRESDPRTRNDRRGIISSVSFKRKLRDLVADKDSELWKELKEDLELEDKDYQILEMKDTDRKEIAKLSSEELKEKYWDVRVFGTTFLEQNSKSDKEKNSHIATGVVQFGIGTSVDPVTIDRLTTTKVLAVEEGKDKGMAPLSFRVVEYGLYVMPFFVNATAAGKTDCSKKDIELLKRLIPHAYKETASYMRPQVAVRHAYYIEHAKPRSTFNDLSVIDNLTPVRKDAAENTPAKSWKDYDSEKLNRNVETLKADLISSGKAVSFVDLAEEL